MQLAFALGVISVLSLSPTVWAQDTIPLKLELPQANELLPLPAVFVDGELVGTVNGVIPISFDRDQKVIEIGFTQVTNTPLYSVVLGRSDFEKNSVKVTYSAIDFTSTNPMEFWADARMRNNSTTIESLNKDSKGGYTLILPTEPYSAIATYMNANLAEVTQTEWKGVIRYYDSVSAKDFLGHHYFDMKSKEVASLDVYSGEWSGSLHLASWPGGLSIPTKKWSITSDPPGAMIVSEARYVGTTNVNAIDLTWTRSSYLSLKLAGYYEITDASCVRSVNGEITHLHCDLQKIP